MKKLRRIFKAGTTGITTDYSKFKHVKYNRGRKTSIDEGRVSDLQEMDDEGNYYDICVIIINVFGYILNGHHSFEKKKRAGEKVVYYVSTDLQTTDQKELLKAISRINAHNAKWQKKETSLTAKAWKFPLALKISEVIDQISLETEIKTNKIMESWIFALIHQDAKMFNSSKKLDLLETFDDPDSLAAAQTVSFESDVELYIDIVEVVKHIGSRFNNACNEILKLHWNNKLFNVNVLLDKIATHGFNPETDSKGDVKVEIQRIYNYGRGRAKVYNQFFGSIVPHRNSSDVIKAYLVK